MSKIAVIYWSGTGNTEAMAHAVAAGVEAKGAEVALFTPSEFDVSTISEYAGIGFGCPSMGAEVLEEAEFEPMFNSIISKLGGIKVALFGSYGWGDGEWMRNWQQECENAGIQLVADGLICNECPDEEAKIACENLGSLLVG